MEGRKSGKKQTLHFEPRLNPPAPDRPGTAEPEGFSHFHLYVCAAFLVRWRKEILEERDFQGLMLLLQNLPTMHWGNEEVSVLLAEAYRLKFAFADAPNHYKR
ncbi:hypothetical protein fugu_019758 [Takifugu bimaculatus]|uniref:Uncharacterized protein n=1 Tax=Takifugu bimaculatus TaxID=433685 RepID=A0A4Z2BI29_9TELE|nr:hypothetical protein fugu_019758 [Takifugu bimaculatus]